MSFIRKKRQMLQQTTAKTKYEQLKWLKSNRLKAARGKKKVSNVTYHDSRIKVFVWNLHVSKPHNEANTQYTLTHTRGHSREHRSRTHIHIFVLTIDICKVSKLKQVYGLKRGRVIKHTHTLDRRRKPEITYVLNKIKNIAIKEGRKQNKTLYKSSESAQKQLERKQNRTVE